MQEIQYKTFSLRNHKKNWRLKRPNVSQFELTFRCGLHCKHCYADCYNKARYLKRELNTQQVKLIVDKLYQEGVIWLCFTGGDPLTREDFLEIYSYAKDKGFIISLFSNGYSMTNEIIQYLKKRPPFGIEMTLNAVTECLYEEISQVRGSFVKVIKGIDLILKAGLSLKIKTQPTVDNWNELPKIRKFIKGLGLQFLPSASLHACLNGSVTPCNLRVSVKQLATLDTKKTHLQKECTLPHQDLQSTPSADLFSCTIGGGDGIYLDPYGNTFPCYLIRKPAFNLLDKNLGDARTKLLSLVRNKKFTTASKCNNCTIRKLCRWCPGRALLEVNDMEAPIEYHCELAKLQYRFRKINNA